VVAAWISNYYLGKNRIVYAGFEVLTAVIRKSSVFWDITPCSPLKSLPTFRRNSAPLAACFHACSDYSSTLKMEAICSSET
jgi:hypothetical protein